MLLTDVRVGNETHARLARSMTSGSIIDFVIDWTTVTGWHQLRLGSHWSTRRNILRSPDQVVYKVGYSQRTRRENSFEIYHYQRLGSNPFPGWYIPDMQLFELDNNTNVLAVEFIDGRRAQWNEFDQDYIECQLGLNDVHEDNVIKTDDRLWLVDLGGTPWNY